MTFSLACIQFNPTVGHLRENFEKIALACKKYKSSDLVVFSELSLTGYPIDDLPLNSEFQSLCIDYIEKLKALSKESSAFLIGIPIYEEGKIYNAVLFLHEGKIIHEWRKTHLPNIGVFDEKRIFTSYPAHLENKIFSFKGINFHITICEDMWANDPIPEPYTDQIDIVIGINASPYDSHKRDERLIFARNYIHKIEKPLVYVNQYGGQDELVFDGASFVIDKDQSLIHQCADWQDDVIELTIEENGLVRNTNPKSLDNLTIGYETIYHALMQGVKDYVYKNGFQSVILGLSGGLDSALTCAIAVDALGAENVHTVMMPSRYTSQESLDHAKESAEFLGVNLINIPIDPLHKEYEKTLAPLFQDRQTDITEENIQSRIRGNLLMALSNKFNHLLLSTGNKSEYAMGYATLYGDMCGGYAVIKDVYKTKVTELSVWRNRTFPKLGLGPKGKVMNDNVITKAPSAELKPNQKDSDSLPEYYILDQILELMIEEEKTNEHIIDLGFLKEDVLKTRRALNQNDFKRFQAAPGPKISRKAFGRERRYPLTK